MPVSAIVTSTAPESAEGLYPNVAVVAGVLGRVVEQVPEHLGHALPIDVDEEGPRGHVDGEPLALLLDERRGHLHGVGQHVADVGHLPGEPHPVSQHARDVEQIVDETHHVL
jgi:hypothetical protein